MFRRNPASILESKGISEEDKGYQNELEKLIPKSTRHIFLIRHGQYNLDGATDKDRYLTPLGRKQAEYTGMNLIKNLSKSFNSNIYIFNKKFNATKITYRKTNLK